MALLSTVSSLASLIGLYLQLKDRKEDEAFAHFCLELQQKNKREIVNAVHQNELLLRSIQELFNNHLTHSNYDSENQKILEEILSEVRTLKESDPRTEEAIPQEIIRLNPLDSFFKPISHKDDDEDSKHIVGRGFHISASFDVCSLFYLINITRIKVEAWHHGLSLLGAQSTFKADGNICVTDNNYNFTPRIVVEEKCVKHISITRKFYPPYQGRGTPFKYRNAELQIVIEFVVEGIPFIKNFYFNTNYELNSLTALERLSEVTRFRDEQITLALINNVITKDESELLLSIDPETRVRAIDGHNLPYFVDERHIAALKRVDDFLRENK